jgi:hypothetical protein
MSHRGLLSRLALVVLLAGLIAAPAASATPFESQGTVTQDARGEAPAGGGTGAPEPAGTLELPSLPSPPTSSAEPASLPARDAAPSTDGASLDLAVVLLVVAGTVALGSGTALVAIKAREDGHPAF